MKRKNKPGRVQRQAAKLDLEIQRMGRKRHAGFDPNDRLYDPKTNKTLRRMDPAELDAMLSDRDEDEDLSDDLVKIHLDLPNHWATGGEALWARPVGPDLYEVRNFPFYAYDINYRDVVRATPDREDLKPEVRGVVTRSGHRTLLDQAVDAKERIDRLESLKPHGTDFEGARASLFAIDVSASGDYDAVCAQLQAWETDGILN